MNRSDRTDDHVNAGAWLRDDVALLSEQTQHKFLGVAGPAVDPGVLHPAGNVCLPKGDNW